MSRHYQSLYGTVNKEIRIANQGFLTVVKEIQTVNKDVQIVDKEVQTVYKGCPDF